LKDLLWIICIISILYVLQVLYYQSCQFSHSCVWLFASPWTAAHQASLSINNSWSLLKLMSIGSVMPSNHLILCHSLLLPQSFSASVLSMNVQYWFPLDGLIGSPCSPGDSWESSPMPRFGGIDSLELSFLYGPTQLRTLLVNNWQNWNTIDRLEYYIDVKFTEIGNYTMTILENIHILELFRSKSL